MFAANKNLKYPLYLFLGILIAKMIYIVIESYYNFHVLTVTTDPTLSRNIIEELNINGHRISAIGITLLLLPYLYILAKKISRKMLIGIFFIFTSITYLLSYESLNIIVDKIVEINKDKRHDAYYISIFKYGVLNDIFAYDSFVNHEHIQKKKITVNDRIKLTNSFLLMYADPVLIEKLKNRSKPALDNLYVIQNLQKDYNTTFEQYKGASEKILEQWHKFSKKKKELNEELKSLDDESSVKKEYEKFTDSLSENYRKYQKGWKNVGKKIISETHLDKIAEIKKKLNKYFMYRGFKHAEEKYRNEMNANFGHYIEPKRWKDDFNQVTQKQIAQVIKEEIVLKSKVDMGELPRGLTFKEFLHHHFTKNKVQNKFKKKNIIILDNFDYSYKQFYKSFLAMVNRKKGDAHTIFYDKLKKQIGKNDLRVSMNWEDYIQSQFIQNKIRDRLKPKSFQELKNISDTLVSRDHANFKKLVYLPAIRKNATDMLYDKNHFKDNEKAEQKGDDAIKLLYIPPFALSVSIIALLLNILTVMGMLLSLMTKFSFFKIRLMQIIFFIMILVVPLLFENKNFNNGLMQKLNTTDLNNYVHFLNWISFYEKLNYPLHI